MNEQPATQVVPIVRCAIYSRSHTNNGVSTCRAAAAAHSGWVVVEHNVYCDTDDTESLALTAMLNEASRQPRPFDLVLTASTADLAGPAQGDEVLNQLLNYGIPVHFVSLGADSRDAVLRYTVAFCRTLVDPDYVVSDDLVRLAEMQHETELALAKPTPSRDAVTDLRRPEPSPDQVEWKPLRVPDNFDQMLEDMLAYEHSSAGWCLLCNRPLKSPDDLISGTNIHNCPEGLRLIASRDGKSPD